MSVIGRYDVKKGLLHRDACIRPSRGKRHGSDRLFNRRAKLRKMAVKRVLAPASSITRMLSTSTKARAAAHRASLSASDKTLEGDCCVGYSYTAGTLIDDHDHVENRPPLPRPRGQLHPQRPAQCGVRHSTTARHSFTIPFPALLNGERHGKRPRGQAQARNATTTRRPALGHATGSQRPEVCQSPRQPAHKSD